MKRGDWVLVVDDDQDLLELMQLVLSSAGFRVVTAGDGLEGWARMTEADPPSLVILDLRMPGLNGEEFLKALRRRVDLDGLPVVLMSGDHGAAVVCSSLGAQGVLQKPFGLERLLDLVQRFVAREQPMAEPP